MKSIDEFTKDKIDIIKSVAREHAIHNASEDNGFTVKISKKDIKWEVFITYNLLWFFLFIFSRTIFAYFDYIIKKVRGGS